MADMLMAAVPPGGTPQWFDSTLASSGFSRWLIDNFDHFKQTIVWLLVALIVLILWEAASWAHHKKMTAPLGGVPDSAPGGTAPRPAGSVTLGGGAPPGAAAAPPRGTTPSGASSADRESTVDEDPFKALMQAKPQSMSQPAPPAGGAPTGSPQRLFVGEDQDLLSASGAPPSELAALSGEAPGGRGSFIPAPPRGEESDPWKTLMQEAVIAQPSPPPKTSSADSLNAMHPSEWMTQEESSSAAPEAAALPPPSPPPPVRRPLDLGVLSATPPPAAPPETDAPADRSGLKQFLRETLAESGGTPRSTLPLDFPTAPGGRLEGAPPGPEPPRHRALELGESLKQIKDSKGDSVNPPE